MDYYCCMQLYEKHMYKYNSSTSRAWPDYQQLDRTRQQNSKTANATINSFIGKGVE